ncbi:ATP-dependent helicase [Weissella soli]|uniref:ATP-dependent helicase n=1 Tax=Weissella soli TaxID=155866 RepID=UPI0011BB1B06|nr:ATP-dependent helicase [Weissella soli]QEA35796.1 ATP-dependent helicase [Weissella soli]
MIDNIEDLAVRQAIVEADGNAVVLASAGTGKTHTIIDKIQYISENDVASFKKIAAITFTEKAADEIKERLHENKTESLVVAKTMHAWVLSEILQPFLPNMSSFNFEGNIKFGFGKTKPKIKSFEEGLHHLDINGEILSYVSKPKWDVDPTVSYTEDGNDFTFQLAMEVLINSQSASDYIKSAYRWIYVDEYQDVNKDQNALIQYLIDELHIKAVLVGDNKQEIYSFRGSNGKYLTDFSDRADFESFRLTHNFRSNAGIVSYSRLFDSGSFEKNEFSIKDCRDVTFVPVTDENLQIKDLASRIMRENPRDSIMILRSTNGIISQLKSSSDFFNKFQTRVTLAYEESDFAAFFSMLIKIRFDAEILFGLTQFIPINIFHKNFLKLRNKLDAAVSINGDQENQEFYNYVRSLSNLDILEVDWQAFESSLADEKQIETVLEGHQKYSILTVHSAKGLEADHVIYSTNDAFWRGKFQENNHYVAITRAKKKLWLLDTSPMYKTKLVSLLQK